MATVTNLTQGRRHIVGDLVARVFIFSGPSGSTLQVPVPAAKIDFINNQTATNPANLNPPSAASPAGTLITSWVVTAGPNPETATITFTSSAPMVGEVVIVVARVG